MSAILKPFSHSLDSISNKRKGIAIGSSLGPILANISITNFELRINSKITMEPLHIHYVDDILIRANSKEKDKQLVCGNESLHDNTKQ